MALKALIGKLTGKPDRGPWQPAAGLFPRLMLMDTPVLERLKEQGGLYAFWHRGVRPQWIYVGYTGSLGETLVAAQEDPDLALYDLNEGVFAAWAACLPNQRQAAVMHLRNSLEPALKESPLDEFGPVDPEIKPLEFPPPMD